MSITLTIVDGLPALEIPDSRGNVHAYTIERLPAPDRERRYRLYRIDADESYEVTHTPGNWRCSCPAWRYSRALVRTCKHCERVRELRDVLKVFLKGLAPFVSRVGDLVGSSVGEMPQPLTRA